MRFAFTEDQEALRQAVRHVLDRECTAADVRAVVEADGDPAAGRSAERWAVLSELGAPGLAVPESAGGLGLGEVDLVGVLEEAGRAGLPEPLAETAAVAGPVLAAALAGGEVPPELASEAEGDRWSGRAAAGELVLTAGGVEPAPGRLAATSSPVEAAEGGLWRTPRVATASRAGLFLLARETDGGWELHAVRAEAALVTVQPTLDPTRGLGTVEWVPGPGTRLLAGRAAADAVADLADRGAFATAAELLGLADRMVALAAEYALGRVQFGRPIGSFQAVKHLLADARVALEFARPAVYRAAWSLATGQATSSHDVSMAKALAADAATLAARNALQVHGAIGYTWECDLQLFMKRTWALAAAWGDAPTHRARALAAALGR